MPFASVRRAAFGASATLLAFHVTACSDSGSDTPTPGAGGAGVSSGATTMTAATNNTTASIAAASTTTTAGTGTTNSSSTAAASSGTTTAGPSSTGSGGATVGTATATAGDVGMTSAGGTGGSVTSSTGSGGATSSTGGGMVNAVLTDDFESVAAGSPPDAALWQLRVPAGENSIEVTSEQFRGGSQSVKVVGASGSTMFFTENVFPLPSGVVYFRVWMRFTDDDWSNHNAFVAAGPGEESQEARFGGQNNAYHANLPADGDVLSPDPYESPECTRCVAPVADEWKCLRGKLDFMNNAAELYVGEQLAVDTAADGWHNQSATGTFPQDPTQIGFGWALYGAQPNTVYFDDIAIGYEPIACD